MTPRKTTKSRAKPATRSRAPRATGRLPVEVDLEQLDTLARIQCTHAEIAAVLKIHPNTLARRFGERIKEGKEAGKSSLRRAQWKSALAGNATMQIWLGKQELGQRDRHDVTGPEGQPLVPAAIRLIMVPAPGSAASK